MNAIDRLFYRKYLMNCYGGKSELISMYRDTYLYEVLKFKCMWSCFIKAIKKEVKRWMK
jgi:hypothetical protein